MFKKLEMPMLAAGGSLLLPEDPRRNEMDGNRMPEPAPVAEPVPVPVGSDCLSADIGL